MPPSSPQPEITYKHIAQRCGVSQMTVSRVIRGQGYVKAATRDKVLEAVKQLGYRPNPLVQTLMSSVRQGKVTRQSNLAWAAAYDLENPHSPYMEVLHQAVRKRAEHLGFGLEIISLQLENLTATRLSRILRARGVAGIIVSPLAQPGTLPFIPWDEYPCATIGRSLTAPRIHYTMSHFQHIMEQVLAQLSQRGYHRPAYLDDSYMDQRQDHAASMVFDHYLRSLPRKDRIPSEQCDGWDFRRLSAWLDKHRPDVVISGGTRIFDMLTESDLSVPHDIGFVTLSWRESHPECTGVKNPFIKLGMGAVDLVVAQIHRNEKGPPPHPKAMLLEGDWVEGTTLLPVKS